MAQTQQDKLRELTERLNRYRDEYYNKNAPSVSDEVYDVLFDDLKVLEQTLGIRMANSPTQTVGYPAVGQLAKTHHSIPLLSLDKTKSVEELERFQADQTILLMLKLNGLTVKLTYENGTLQQAATRGDGEEGEVITHNACGISGIPMQIPYTKRLVVTGEAFIHTNDFAALQGTLLDSSGYPYRNGRNLAAGSVRLLDAAVCRQRRVSFMPFNVLEGFEETPGRATRLRALRKLGFAPCFFYMSTSPLTVPELTDIRSLELMPGNRILVSKRNQIIPHVEDNIDRGYFSPQEVFPETCPCCGSPVTQHAGEENGRSVNRLFCDNPQCTTRRLRQFVHFAGEKAMNIAGLSEGTLEKFIGMGWLQSCPDIYRLDEHRAEMIAMDGFGEKSWQKLWDAIEQSRNTTFQRFLVALDIPMIGRTASRTLGELFHENPEELENAVYEGYDFSKLPDFGETLNRNIHDWFDGEENLYLWEELQKMVHIRKTAPLPLFQNGGAYERRVTAGVLFRHVQIQTALHRTGGAGQSGAMANGQGRTAGASAPAPQLAGGRTGDRF